MYTAACQSEPAHRGHRRLRLPRAGNDDGARIDTLPLYRRPDRSEERDERAVQRGTHDDPAGASQERG